MRQNPWDTVENVINISDIVIYLLDSRFPGESRNLVVEKMLAKKRKPFIAVFTKSDLSGGRLRIPDGFRPFAVVSATNFNGIAVLKKQIKIMAKRIKAEKPRVGVVGYPNIGKSSLINALSGRGAARTSSTPGMTKGKQYISAGGFMLIDTPGVIPRIRKDDLIMVKMSVTDPSPDDADFVATSLMRENPGLAETQFGIPETDDKEEMLEHIARKKNLLRKGGEPDTQRAALLVLKLYREGKRQ